MEMNPQTHAILTTRHDPQTDENVMQERSCDPALDSSLLADDVLINHMRDMDQSAQATLFVP
jgi:hypothetical protein